MTREQARIIEQASLDLEDMLDALERHGPGYLKDYVAWLTEGKPQKRWPERPSELRVELAKALREACLDSAAATRVMA